MDNPTCAKLPRVFSELRSAYTQGAFYFILITAVCVYLLIKVVPKFLNKFLTDKIINVYVSPDRLKTYDAKTGGMVKKFMSKTSSDKLDELINKLNTNEDPITKLTNQSILINLITVCLFIIVIGGIFVLLPTVLCIYCGDFIPTVAVILMVFVGIAIVQGIFFKFIAKGYSPIGKEQLLASLKKSLLNKTI